MHRVVITGIGVVAANGRNSKEFLASLRSGTSGITYQPRLKELNFRCCVVGLPLNLDELIIKNLPEDLLFAMNSGMIYSTLAAIECWQDAGFEIPRRHTTAVDWSTGAIIGASGGGLDTLGDIVVPKINSGNVQRLGSTMVEQVMSSSVSAPISGLLALGGPVLTNSSACASGSESILLGHDYIKSGRLKRCLVGGAEGASHYMWGAFDAMRLLASGYNETPKTASRPLSSSSTGFVPSAGAGILMLEDFESARDRGAKIYAEILGGYSNCGGQRNGGSMSLPNPEAIIRCIEYAIQNAKVNASDIDLINGHFTGTKADLIEFNSWVKALNLTIEGFPYINATKSLIGHALGAAGGIESVASVLQIQNNFVHGTINSENLYASIEEYRSHIPIDSIAANINIVAKSSFGFGDVNCCILFKKLA